MTSTLDHALEYLKRGWSVVPWKSKEAAPPVSWQTYSRRLPTVVEVTRWWTKWPRANIALVTGKLSGVIVVDIDTYKGGSDEGMEPTGLTARSGGGGIHRYYQYPDTYVKSVSEVHGEGIDIRGDGGLIVLPPSLHKSGNNYTWISEGTPAPCPSWVTRPVIKEKGEVEPWITELLSTRFSGSANRNSATARLAGYFLSKGHSQDITLALCTNWMALSPNPLGETEVAKTVNSVYLTHHRAEREVEESKTATPAKKLAGKGLQLVKYGDFIEEHAGHEVTWLVEQWIPSQSILMAVASPESYKTWTTIDLAVAIATGTDFMGFKVTEPGPVIIIQQEDPHHELATRFSVVAASKTGLELPTQDGDLITVDIPDDLPIYFHTERSVRFDDKEAIDKLRERIIQIRPKLIIFDPLYSTVKVDDYMAGSVQDMRVLKILRDQFALSVLLVHHMKKGDSDEWTGREAAWGSVFIDAFCEGMWMFKTTSNPAEVVIKRRFKSAKRPPPVRVVFAIDTGDETYSVEVEEVDEETAEEKIKKPSGLDVYTQALDVGPLSMTQLCETTGRNKSSVSRALKKLVAEGEVTKNGDGTWELAIEL